MRKILSLVAGVLVLVPLASAAHAAAPVATGVPLAPLAQSVAGAAQQAWELPQPGSDFNADRELSLRFAERGGGKVGAAVGLAVGGSVGFALFGTPGAALFGAVGAFCGEVLGEFTASSLFGPRRTPYMPPLSAPLIPGR